MSLACARRERVVLPTWGLWLTFGIMLVAPAAYAVDGVAEINETCAVQTGCLSGDTAGYPVTIDGTAGGN